MTLLFGKTEVKQTAAFLRKDLTVTLFPSSCWKHGTYLSQAVVSPFSLISSMSSGTLTSWQLNKVNFCPQPTFNIQHRNVELPPSKKILNSHTLPQLPQSKRPVFKPRGVFMYKAPVLWPQQSSDHGWSLSQPICQRGPATSYGPFSISTQRMSPVYTTITPCVSYRTRWHAAISY